MSSPMQPRKPVRFMLQILTGMGISMWCQVLPQTTRWRGMKTMVNRTSPLISLQRQRLWFTPFPWLTWMVMVSSMCYPQSITPGGSNGTNNIKPQQANCTARYGMISTGMVFRIWVSLAWPIGRYTWIRTQMESLIQMSRVPSPITMAIMRLHLCGLVYTPSHRFNKANGCKRTRRIRVVIQSVYPAIRYQKI